jgi:hypothetical protein
MMRSYWNWNARSRRRLPSATGRGKVGRSIPLLLLVLSTAPARAQKGLPMTPERLTSITHGRTLSLRCRAMALSQVCPNVTQQMMYRTRLAPETADLSLSVFCSGARIYQFEQAMTTLFGYRLVGRSQGEGMGLFFVPDPQAMAAAGRQRLQGRTAAEAGIARALAWIRQPAGLDEIARTSCPAAGTLRDPSVKRAFTLYSTLTRAQRETVLSGHPVTVPFGALSPAGRAVLGGIRPAAKSVTVYLHDDPWSESSHPRLAVRAEPSGPTWISCPPLALAPAHGPLPAEVAEIFRMKLKGAPDLEDLEPGEEAPTLMEWLSDQTGVWILAEACRPFSGKPEALKKLSAEFSGLTLEEALDRIASVFDATWRCADGWVLFQRRSTETLMRGRAPAAVQIGRGS